MTDRDEVTLRPTTLSKLLAQRTTTVSDIGGYSRQGRRRGRNEDAWGFDAGRTFVVADGMGGRSAGDIAAQATVTALLAELDDKLTDWRRAIDNVNDAVCAAGASGHIDSLGAVAVGLRCADGRVSIVNVGDARAYRLRDGLTQQLTRDHSIAEAMADLGLRRSDTGLADRQLGALTSYFGSPGSAEEFSVHELSAHDGDRIVLCSDGVHQAVSIANWSAAGRPISAGAAAEQLVRDAAEHGATDDCTALVIDLDVAANPDESGSVS